MSNMSPATKIMLKWTIDFESGCVLIKAFNSKRMKLKIGGSMKWKRIVTNMMRLGFL